MSKTRWSFSCIPAAVSAYFNVWHVSFPFADLDYGNCSSSLTNVWFFFFFFCKSCSAETLFKVLAMPKYFDCPCFQECTLFKEKIYVCKRKRLGTVKLFFSWTWKHVFLCYIGVTVLEILKSLRLNFPPVKNIKLTQNCEILMLKCNYTEPWKHLNNIQPLHKNLSYVKNLCKL